MIASPVPTNYSVTPVRGSTTGSSVQRALITKPATGPPGGTLRKRVFDYDVKDDNTVSFIL